MENIEDDKFIYHPLENIEDVDIFYEKKPGTTDSVRHPGLFGMGKDQFM